LADLKRRFDSNKGKAIVKIYNSKSLVEDDFKLLNDQLLVPVGPVYHRKDEYLRVHVFLAMIGLLFYRYLAWETKIYGLSMNQIFEKLSEIKIAIVQERESKKSKIIVEEMDTKQASLFSFLNMEKYLPS